MVGKTNHNSQVFKKCQDHELLQGDQAVGVFKIYRKSGTDPSYQPLPITKISLLDELAPPLKLKSTTAHLGNPAKPSTLFIDILNSMVFGQASNFIDDSYDKG